VRRVVREITEQGLAGAGVLTQEGDGPVGQIIGDVALALDRLAVVVERRVEVLTPVTGGEAIVLLEAAAVGVVGVLRAVVPLAEAAGGVAGRLERFGDRPLVEVEPLQPGRDAAHAAARVPAAGEQLGPRRRADRLHEEALEAGAVLRQRVDVRRAQVGVAVEAQIAPALVVGEDDDDVRPGRGGPAGPRGGGEGEQAKQQPSRTVCHGSVTEVTGVICPCCPDRPRDGKAGGGGATGCRAAAVSATCWRST
jgi:hypothetical protein